LKIRNSFYMTEQAKKYLHDIYEAIQAIEKFVENMNFYDYEDDLKTKSAVERQLGIIGEAVNKFTKIEPDNQLTNAKEIVSFRNRIIHAYDSIDDSIVWAIKTNHLPLLKKEVLELL
jgi:uncharacterized protein with HEPN domain